MVSPTDSQTESFELDDNIVKKFIYATIIWGAVALFLGVFVATQLANWRFNFGISWLTFGRLRPLHTNAAIFAFIGNAVFAGIYHSSQRLLKTRMYSDLMSKIHFWGWQLIIVGAAITLPLGYTSGKEYAELQWPLDIMIAVIWVVFAINYFMTLKIRRERHIYVAIWFYIATIVTIALLHIVNSLAIPYGWFSAYSAYAGVQDALVQWWYGHNAVAFFLTTPFLGLPTSYLNSKIEYKTHESWALQMGDNFGGGKSRDFKKVVDFFCVFGHFRGEGKANFSFFVEKNAGLNSKESLPNKFWAKLNILKFNPIFKVSN